MKDELLKLQEKIDGMSQRERVLILLVGIFVVVMLMQTLLLDPVLKERGVTKKQITQTRQQIADLNNEQQVLNAQLTAGVTRHELKRRDQMRQEVHALNKKIETSVVAMIPPHLMPEVLENILGQNKKLTLLSLENKPVVSVLEQMTESESNKNTENNTDKGQALYKHAFVIKLRGNYMSAIDYFKTLEQLPWRFYWDELHYQVDSYPNAVISLEVHTVSMSEEWIGV